MSGLEARAADADADVPASSQGEPLPGSSQAAPQAPQAQPAAGVELARKTAGEIAGLLTMLAAGFAPAFPCLATIYTAETCSSVGDAVAPVCVKHGWHLGGQYAEEIAAMAIVGPLIIVTAQGIAGDVKARAQKQPDNPPTKKPEARQTVPPGNVPLPLSDA